MQNYLTYKLFCIYYDISRYREYYQKWHDRNSLSIIFRYHLVHFRCKIYDIP